MFAPRLTATVCLGLALLAVPTVHAQDALKTLDPWLPADTESYISVNVRQVMESPIFKKQLLGPAKEALENLEEVKSALKDLGFDPFKNLDRVIFASPSTTDTDRGLIIAHGTFDVAKVTKKLEAMAKEQEDSLKAHKVPLGGGLTHPVYEVVIPGQEMPLFLSVASEKTLLVSPGKDYVVDSIKANKTKKPVALKNKAFQSLLEKMDSKQSLSIAMMGKNVAAGDDADPILKLLSDAFGGVEALGGGVTMSDEVKLELVVAGKSAEAAESVRKSAERGVRMGLVGLALLGEERKELSLLLDVLKTVKVSGKGKVVSITGKMTADVLQDFFKKGE